MPQVKYAADEGEVYRIVSGCLSVGCNRKQMTNLAGNGEDKDSVAETAIFFLGGRSHVWDCRLYRG